MFGRSATLGGPDQLDRARVGENLDVVAQPREVLPELIRQLLGTRRAIAEGPQEALAEWVPEKLEGRGVVRGRLAPGRLVRSSASGRMVRHRFSFYGL